MKVQFFYIYVLFSNKDKQLYIGYTEDLKTRLGEHFKGRVVATKNRRPILLIHYEAFTDKKDAKARERFLKSDTSNVPAAFDAAALVVHN